jgi:hypothetical protein
MPFFILLVVAVVAIIMYTLAAQQQQHRARHEFAERHGLTFRQDTQEVEGLFQGLPLKLSMEMRGPGRSRYPMTVVRLRLGDALFHELTLLPQPLHQSWILRVLGMAVRKDVFPKLDDGRALGHLAPEVRAVLTTPDVRGRLEALAASSERLALEAGHLQVELRHQAMNADELEAQLAPMLDTVRAMNDAAWDSRMLQKAEALPG